MPYVSRRDDGSIYGLFTVRQHPGQEELADDHADVVAFRNPPPRVPENVTAAQMIRALDQMELLADVKAAVTAAGGLTLELWNHAPFFHRGDPLIAGVAAALGKSDAEIDELFTLAATF